MKSVTAEDSTPPPTKKMKQATLPFLALSNKTKSPLLEKSKKRKKSDSDSDDIQVLKVICNEKNTDSTICVLPNMELKTEAADELLKSSDVEDKIEKVQDVTEEEDQEMEQDQSDAPPQSSSPLPSVSTSEHDDDSEEEATEVPASDTSMNVSALLDGDDKDSLISLSDIPLTPMKTPTSANKKPRKLTPKQIQRQEELQKRRLEKEKEKEREKEERERKKQEEKENKRRQREEKEEQKKMEKLEREKKRQAEIDQKNEEKRAKEEERRRKEEEKVQEKRKKEEEKVLEKKRREEEKLQRDEEKKKAEIEALKKKEKAAAAFASFFVPKKTDHKHSSPVAKAAPVHTNFMPFEVKADMKLAPTIRRLLAPEQKQILDNSLKASGTSVCTYTQQLKSGSHKPMHQGKTWPVSDIKNEVMIIEEEETAGQAIQVSEDSSKCTMRAKLLQFHENQRPPYWGTWRKKSLCVRPRRPLALDKVQFDYEVDSEEEWEEEEPGESIKGSEDEAEKESEDDYEVDNEFFVPHGYLSDEEAGQEEAIPPEAQKERLKLLEKEFNAEMKQKKQQLKPRIHGIFFLTNSDKQKDPVYNQLMNLMKPFMALRVPTVIPTSFNQPSEPTSPDKDGNSAKRGAKRKHVPEEAVPALIRLAHGNIKAQSFLSKEFVAYWEAQKAPEDKKEDELIDSPGNKKREISIANAVRKLKELASWRTCPDEGPLQGKMCWYVPEDVRQAYGLADLTLPNQWRYTLTRAKKVKKEEPVTEEVSTKPVTPKTTPQGSLITKFTKKLSDEERKKQIKRKSAVPVVTTTPKVKPKLPASPFSPMSAFCISPNTAQVTGSSSQFKQPSPVTSNGIKSSKPNEKKGRRVSILVSVPRGQEIPAHCSVTQAVKTHESSDTTSTGPAMKGNISTSNTQDKEVSREIKTNEDDCIILD